MEWLVAGRARRKLQTAGTQSPEAPETKGTDCSTPFISVKANAPGSKIISIIECQRKYDPGFEKTEKIKRLKTKL